MCKNVGHRLRRFFQQYNDLQGSTMGSVRFTRCGYGNPLSRPPGGDSGDREVDPTTSFVTCARA